MGCGKPPVSGPKLSNDGPVESIGSGLSFRATQGDVSEVGSYAEPGPGKQRESAVLEFTGSIEDGLPQLETTAYAVLAEPDLAGVIYVPSLTVAAMDDSGVLTESNLLLNRIRELGWAPMSEVDDWSAPRPGWDAVLAGECFTVTQPDGGFWYEGDLPTSPAWRAAVQRTGLLRHFTADHNDLDSVREDITSGNALVVVSSVSSST